MLSARQLGKRIDSLNKTQDSMEHKAYTDLGFYLHYGNPPDSLWKSTPKSIGNQLFPDSLTGVIHRRSTEIANQIKSNIQYNNFEFETRKDEIRHGKIEWHRKFSLSLACLILFFIGAPLGSIIRKGGLGMPLVAAIILFLIFHLLYVFGEKFVKQNVLSPVIGMWLPIIILLPVGIFFTYKAMQDSQLFNKEFYSGSIKRIRSLFRSLSKT
jgi:lipopolysaccharide export system permease protein